MHRIRRFGVVKTATVVAVMYLVIIAIVFVPIAILAIVFGASGSGGGNGIGGGVAVLAFGLVAALFYAVIGWIFTALACAVYNLAARWVGGIEVEIEPVAPPPSLPAWTASSTPPPPAITPPAG
jgi:hypothetical protein